ncbi:hypothetical protein [Agrococcus beijingensis]|uniref:hypothetical protein n=1 Tax=Agrococcus beijingensis TaxID=3068634 RepID=UPI0027411570|nr:hypothetical protein [Agrococcus sp. REN33]
MPAPEVEIPLGPLAGTKVPFYRSAHGYTLHGDPTCPTLRRSQLSIEHFEQPASGAFATAHLPPRPHCEPQGRIGRYVHAARWLETERDAVALTSIRVALGERPLDPLRRVDFGLDRRDLEPEDRLALEGPWRQVQASRHASAAAVITNMQIGDRSMAIAAVAA